MSFFPPLFFPTMRAASLFWRLPFHEVLRRFDDVLTGSLVLTFSAIALVGAAMCDQAASQAMRLIGELSFIGPEYIVLGFEEYGPLIVALTFAARTGAGFAAEVALLRNDEALDALSLFGAAPERNLLAPMALAGTIGCTCLGLMSAAVWELSGIITIYARHDVNPFTFFHPDALSQASIALCVIKNTGFGALVFCSALFFGLRAKQGASEVGKATTRSIVLSLVSCLLLNLIVDMAFFLFRGPL
ncbi:MAG: ABC transporter permease [Deltaproteobacteria bacterium]|nr:ABC transporter permease [Deltaproteobacteria bacterium]